jgi:PAS domain S-box-containing protein
MRRTSEIRKPRSPEELLWERTRALHERIKELSCLYQISRLEREDLPTEDFLRGVVSVARVAWQHAEVAGARIRIEGEDYRTDNFAESPWMQHSPITISGEPVGAIEVCYLERRPEAAEGPFQQEERYLIDAIAERVGSALERRRAEEARTAAAERYRALFEQAVVPIIVFDGESGRFLEFNDKAPASLGYTRAEFEGMTLPDLLAQGRLDLSSGVECEIEVRARDGTLHTVVAGVGELRLADRDVISIVWSDITERVRAERALGVAHERLDGMLNALPDLLFEVDLQGRITDAHTGMPELLFLSPETFLGKAASEVLPAPAAQVIGQALAEATEVGRSRGATYTLSLPTGEPRKFELSVARSGDRLIALARDVTDRGAAPG